MRTWLVLCLAASAALVGGSFPESTLGPPVIRTFTITNKKPWLDVYLRAHLKPGDSVERTSTNLRIPVLGAAHHEEVRLIREERLVASARSGHIGFYSSILAIGAAPLLLWCMAFLITRLSASRP